LEYKQEAVRLVTSGQRVSAAKSLGIVDQTLANWVKAHGSRTLRSANKPQVTADQMEIRRLCVGLARVTMDRAILGKATVYFAKVQR
jgi:transposase